VTAPEKHYSSNQKRPKQDKEMDDEVISQNSKTLAGEEKDNANEDKEIFNKSGSDFSEYNR